MRFLMTVAVVFVEIDFRCLYTVISVRLRTSKGASAVTEKSILNTNAYKLHTTNLICTFAYANRPI